MNVSRTDESEIKSMFEAFCNSPNEYGRRNPGYFASYCNFKSNLDRVKEVASKDMSWEDFNNIFLQGRVNIADDVNINNVSSCADRQSRWGGDVFYFFKDTKKAAEMIMGYFRDFVKSLKDGSNSWLASQKFIDNCNSLLEEKSSISKSIWKEHQPFVVSYKARIRRLVVAFLDDISPAIAESFVEKGCRRLGIQPEKDDWFANSSEIASELDRILKPKHAEPPDFRYKVNVFSYFFSV